MLDWSKRCKVYIHKEWSETGHVGEEIQWYPTGDSQEALKLAQESCQRLNTADIQVVRRAGNAYVISD